MGASPVAKVQLPSPRALDFPASSWLVPLGPSDSEVPSGPRWHEAGKSDGVGVNVGRGRGWA